MRALVALMLAASFSACLAAESLEGKYSGGLMALQNPGPRQIPVELILSKSNDGTLVATWNQHNVVCKQFQTYRLSAVVKGDTLELRPGPKGGPQGQCAIPLVLTVQGNSLSADTDF